MQHSTYRMARLFPASNTTKILALFALARHCHSFSPVASSSRAFTQTTSLAMSKRVLVPIAAGSEEIETTCLTDTLTRFGADVTVASVMAGGELVCKMSRGIKFMADATIEEAAKEEWDLVVLPGGMPGAEHLRDSKPLIQLLEKQKAQGKLYAAVCASPAVVLASKSLIPDGASATCYPAPKFRDALSNAVDDAVVVVDNLTTSQGPGTSLKFALELGEQLYGKEKRDQIAQEMLVE